MNIDAFRCMRHGLQLKTLTPQDASLLAPIEQRSNNNQHALLLIHGFSSSPAVYRYLLPVLSQYYDALFCPVLRGHADSIEAFAKVKAKDWLEQIEQIYKILLNEFSQIDVLGLSLGGLLACHLSLRFNLPQLYLLAPALDLHLTLKSTIIIAKILNWLGFRRIRAAAGNLYTSENCEIAYRQLPLTAIIEILMLVQEFQFISPTCPTDLFLGCHDEVVSSSRIAERFMNNPQVKIHWLANSAHVLPLDGDIHSILGCIKKRRGLS